MTELINSIVTKLSDYKNSDGDTITNSRVVDWVNQFNEGDRQFLLEEFSYLLPNSYLSKRNVLVTLGKLVKTLAEKYEFNSEHDFLRCAKFLSCQSEDKSQTVILNMVDELLKEKYGVELSGCGTQDCKYWIYIDDVIASGGTFRRYLLKEIEKFGVENFNKSSIKIVSIFFVLHDWGYSNAKYSIHRSIGIDKDRFECFFVHEIKNNPNINYYNLNPTFNLVYPIDSNNDKAKQYLNNLDAEKNENFAFRNPDYPQQENFFSSIDNRNRYEEIILDKGLDIMSRIANLRARGLRPLGITNPTYKTLGTGTHTFTWRNISNTCPLVFWWEANGWTPLFPVANRGN